MKLDCLLLEHPTEWEYRFALTQHYYSRISAAI